MMNRIPLCLGRDPLLAELDHWLDAPAAMVWLVHGIGGIGKSRLAQAFAARAAARGHRVVFIDGQSVEPSPRGVLEALAEALDVPGNRLADLAVAVSTTEACTLVVFDTFERCRQVDGWLRRELLPALPERTRLLIVGRDAPVPQWALLDPPYSVHRSTELHGLDDASADALLAELGLPLAQRCSVVRASHGHPLALRLAARLGRSAPANLSLQPLLEALVQWLHDEVDDPLLRRALHRVAVVRRVTVSLLRALLPEAVDPHATLEALAALPMCSIAADGLIVHDAVRPSLAAHYKAIDPVGHRQARHAAWQALHAESLVASRADLWRYTADLLYLAEAAPMREAFFPTSSEVVAVEPATAADAAAIATIAQTRVGPEEAALVLRWWRAVPSAVRVTRDARNAVSGFVCAAEWSALPRDLIDADPVARAWRAHLHDDPVEPRERVLAMRSMVSADSTAGWSPELAALSLDLKRAYIELRPRLRRLYAAMAPEETEAGLFRAAGFHALPECTVETDHRPRHSLLLDFGPGSVDGWLSQLVAVTLSDADRPSVRLDTAARELCVDGQRVGLTALEFELMHHLVEHTGEAIKRGDLLDEVWGTRYEGGSNVVDVAIRALRRKLGVRAACIETVPRFGYRFRQP